MVLHAVVRVVEPDIERVVAVIGAELDHVLLDTETPFDVALGRYLVRRKRLG